jgi:hypothetical protein
MRWCRRRARLPRRPHSASCGWSASRWCTVAGSSAIGVRRNLWAPAATGHGFDLGPTSLRSLEPFRDHLTIVSNTDVGPAEPFTAREIRNWRRSLQVERGVPHPGPPEADAGRRRRGRGLVRSALRAAFRPGHADSVDTALHRGGRSGRRLRLRRFLRLHRRDQLGVADAAAADDSRPAPRVR